MKLSFLLQKNKRAFTLLEIIISIFIISVLILGVIKLKDNLTTNNIGIINKRNNMTEVYDAALYVENRLKNIDYFENMEHSEFENTILFTAINNRMKEYTYFFFELRNGTLLYRANNSNIPLKIKNFNTFSNSNYIAEDIKEFAIKYEDNLFKIKIVDKYDNEVSKYVLSGVSDE